VYENGSYDDRLCVVVRSAQASGQVVVRHLGAGDDHDVRVEDLRALADDRHVRIGTDFGDPS